MKYFKTFSVLACLFYSLISQSQSDVTLSYTSFLGGSGFDISERLSFNSDSTSFYLCAGTTSQDAPITPNATYPNIGGIKNTYIAKMDLEGNLEFSTYLGGQGVHNVYGMTVDNTDRFIVCGSSLSPDFPLVNAENDEFYSPSMGFLTCFDSNNEIAWSTFVGGNGTDIIRDVKTDSNGNVYITGFTSSPNLASSEVFQQELPFDDFASGFIAKYSPAGDQVWYTYLGDNGFMNAESLEISEDESMLYILGSSTGNSFPFLGHQTENNGGRDVFLASISAPDGNLLWGSYFGGENDEFEGEVVALSDGLIAISGSTKSETSIASQLAYQSEYGGGVTDNFLAVFDDNGSLSWSTYLGGQDSEGGISKNIFARDGTIYLSSKSRSMHEIGAGNQQIEFQAGDFDNVDYLAAFDLEGNLNWCSALNPNYSCTSNFDFIVHNNGTVYSVGIYENMFGQSETEECVSVISPDAQQPVYGGGDEDIGIFIYETNTLSASIQYVGQLKLYPNPATDLINIEAPNLLWTRMELTVTDISGRKVDRIAQFQSGNAYSTAHLSEGVYILTGRFGEKVFREKLVVQR